MEVEPESDENREAGKDQEEYEQNEWDALSYITRCGFHGHRDNVVGYSTKTGFLNYVDMRCTSTLTGNGRQHKTCYRRWRQTANRLHQALPERDVRLRIPARWQSRADKGLPQRQSMGSAETHRAGEAL